MTSWTLEARSVRAGHALPHSDSHGGGAPKLSVSRREIMRESGQLQDQVSTHAQIVYSFKPKPQARSPAGDSIELGLYRGRWAK